MKAKRDDNSRSDSERGPENVEVDRGPVGQILADDVSEARRDYCLAVHQAWVDATQGGWKAYAEFAAAQHRIALDAELRRTSAYQAWFRSTQEARPEEGGGFGFPEVPREAYHRAIEEAARTQQSEWDQAQQAYRLAASEITKAHNAATRNALRTYLGHIQAIWGRADIASVDAAGLVHLTQASCGAAQAAYALRWSQR